MGIFENRGLEELQNQYRDQLETLDRMKANPDIMSEISAELAGLRKDEQDLLYGSPEYLTSKNTYETGFLQFISNKFSGEYVETPAGREAAKGLLKSIRDAKGRLEREAAERNERINKVLQLLDTDPDLRRRYDELTTGVTVTPKKKSGK